MLWLLAICFASALDLTWLPSGDGPLPMSADFHAKLGRLCDMEKPALKTIPTSKKYTIEKMCAQLREAQRVGGGRNDEFNTSWRMGVLVVVMFVAAGVWWLRAIVPTVFSRGRAVGPSAEELRAKRQLRFGQDTK